MSATGATPALMIFDPKLERGGGQVVLEDLLRRLHGEAGVHLVMPPVGQEKIEIPASVSRYADLEDFMLAMAPGRTAVMVSNANSGMPAMLRAARRLRSRGVAAHTVAIVHNYPSDPVRSVATKALLRQFDEAVVVEPGLTSLRADARTPSWLSLQQPLTRITDFRDRPIARTGKVKSYGRPDREKGLDMLPAIFGPLTELGYDCEVAIGSGFSEDDRYAERLRTDLAPWLVEGRRDSSWIEPGDVFVIPSRSEAACLLAQEVLSRGAFGIASRVGLMPYLSPDNVGMRTFPRGDTRAAVRAAREALEMDEERYAWECLEGVRLIEHRAGRWYDDVVRMLLERRQRVPIK